MVEFIVVPPGSNSASQTSALEMLEGPIFARIKRRLKRFWINLEQNLRGLDHLIRSCRTALSWPVAAVSQAGCPVSRRRSSRVRLLLRAALRW